MDYESLTEAGTIHVEYDGPQLDTLALGTLETQLHKIAEKVAIRTLLEDRRGLSAMLDHPGLMSDYSWRHLRKRWPKDFDLLPFDILSHRYSGLGQLLSQIPVIRLRTNDIRSGSLFHDLSLCLAEVLSNPDSRAVLQSFGGNLLYGIYHSGLRGIEFLRSRNDDRSDPPNYDPYDVGDNLRRIATELIANGNGEASTITIKHQIKDGESQVQIRVR